MLVEACLAYKKFSFLFEIASRFLKEQTEYKFFSLVFKACALTKNLTFAMTVLKFMTEDLKVEVSTEGLLSPLFETCIRSHKPEKVEEIRISLSLSELPLECLPSLIRLLSKYHHSEAAYKHFQTLKKAGHHLDNNFVLNSLLDSLLKADKYYLAKEVFEFHCTDDLTVYS